MNNAWRCAALRPQLFSSVTTSNWGTRLRGAAVPHHGSGGLSVVKLSLPCYCPQVCEDGSTLRLCQVHGGSASANEANATWQLGCTFHSIPLDIACDRFMPYACHIECQMRNAAFCATYIWTAMICPSGWSCSQRSVSESLVR